jgi:hypothetical protein
MRPGIVAVAVVGICVLLLIPGISAIDLLQQKSKAVGMGWEDFRAAGMRQKESASTIEDLQGAVDSYTVAEAKLQDQYDSTGKQYDANYYSSMHRMEVDKLYLYQKMKKIEQERAYTAEVLSRSDPNAAMDYLVATDNAKTYEEKERLADKNANYLNVKYNDAYSQEHHGGCLIVTAAFGSPLANEVQLVRDYRDGTIRQSYTGSQFFVGFNAWYYSFSPAVAAFIATHPLVRSVMQACLVPLLAIVLLSQHLHGMLGFSPELATVSVLLFGACFYSLVYVFPPTVLAVWLAQRKGWKIPAPGRMKPFLFACLLLVSGLAAGIVLSWDILAMVSSGLLVACTIVLTAGTASLACARYLASGAGT